MRVAVSLDMNNFPRYVSILVIVPVEYQLRELRVFVVFRPVKWAFLEDTIMENNFNRVGELHHFNSYFYLIVTKMWIFVVLFG